MTDSAQITHLVFISFAGRRWSASYEVMEGRVHVSCRLGRMSARLAGDAARSARDVLEVIVAMYLSAFPAADGGVADLAKLH